MTGKSADDSNRVGTHPGAGRQLSPTCSQPEEKLQLRLQIHLVGGSSGRALAAAQGLALRALLASVGQKEVRPGQELSP
jgi:hypothetical protein